MIQDRTHFLPTSKKEMERLGWIQADVILFSGDAYIDHPSFGVAVLGRFLQSMGLKVAIVPQPNWRDDLRDFKKLGEPRLFFGVSAGSMDSMVNHYTANRRLRSDDAYTPGGKAGMRPDYAVVVYSKILKSLFPSVPLVIGGVEASLRRFSHYDYWADRVKPSVLVESGADMLVYGMGEKPIRQLVERLKAGDTIGSLTNIPQTVYLSDVEPDSTNFISLHSFEEVLKSKKYYAENFKNIEEQSNLMHAKGLVQKYNTKYLIANAQFSPMLPAELDAVYALPFTRLPHPRYDGKPISAWNMIKDSVTMHRGCFGSCSFCTISAHQGKFVVSRSEASVLAEVKQIADSPSFNGTITDLGGPSANMYKMEGFDLAVCVKCRRASCIFPSVCKNLNTDHTPLTTIYRKALLVKGIKHAFVGSGIRYDLLLDAGSGKPISPDKSEYIKQLIAKHVSGRLKVAPEHTEEAVLKMMRKPSYKLFEAFSKIFAAENLAVGKKQQLIPYFISSHPACEVQHMAELAAKTKSQGFQLEQVQDFTPTPMTLATTIYYTGIDPYTGKTVFTAKTAEDKKRQHLFFFWYKPEMKAAISSELKRIGRHDLLKEFGVNQAPHFRQNGIKKPRTR